MPPTKLKFDSCVQKRVTTIGSANVDFVMQLPELPQVGETVGGGTFFQAFGGKGANQAVAVARSGGQSSLVSCVGCDANGNAFRTALDADGVQLDGLEQVEHEPTGSALIMLGAAGSNYIGTSAGASACIDAAMITRYASLFLESALLVLQMEIPVETVRAVLRFAQKHKLPTLLNYAPADDLSLAVPTGLDILVVNETEAISLLGKEGAALAPNWEKVVCVLKARGVGLVVLTLGGEGVWYADAGGAIHMPAFFVKALDTTAAGDTFCGALATALVEGKSTPEAVRFAQAAAALSVTKRGAQSSIPTREQIESFLSIGM